MELFLKLDVVQAVPDTADTVFLPLGICSYSHNDYCHYYFKDDRAATHNAAQSQTSGNALLMSISSL